MKAPKLKTGTWVVVCDGRKALILENKGDADYPDLRTVSVEEHADLPTRELGTDAPGRSISSVGHGRSAMEQTDWHKQEEEAFLVELVRRLERGVIAGTLDALLVVAPPPALAVLRKAYSKHVRKVLVAEIDKDLTGMPVHEIERHLFGERRRA